MKFSSGLTPGKKEIIMNQELPKDPGTAAAALVDLAEKDLDEALCRYPTCRELRQTAPTSGRPSAYCGNPEHTALTSHRARQQLKAVAAGKTPESVSKREAPLGVTQLESLRQSVVSGMLQLQSNLDRYVSSLTELADPDVSAAQIQAALDRAETRIAEAQQSVSAERSLRLAAEAARQIALQDAQAEHDAAELAIQRMEEAEARRRHQEEEAEQRIAEILAEKDLSITYVQAEGSRHREEIETLSRETIAQAEAQIDKAESEARAAEVRAHDAEMKAQQRIELAEQLVTEARVTLERERAEVDHLQRELAETHKLAEQLATEARVTLERERAEVDRLREELLLIRKRADQLDALAGKEYSQ